MVINRRHSFEFNHKASSRQHGAALVISLIILVIMTIIGVSSIQTTTLEERMVSNMRDRNIAFQAAEIALRDAENQLIALDTHEAIETRFNGDTSGFYGFDPGTTNPVLKKVQDAKELFSNEDLWKDSAAAYQGKELSNASGVLAPPKYFVQWIGKHEQTKSNAELGQGAANASCEALTNPNPCIYIFQITARGTGSSDDSQVILRTHFSLAF